MLDLGQNPRPGLSKHMPVANVWALATAADEVYNRSSHTRDVITLVSTWRVNDPPGWRKSGRTTGRK